MAIKTAATSRDSLLESGDEYASSPLSEYLSFPEPAAATRFATEHDVPSILPAAFYALSTTISECTWEGVQKNDLRGCYARPVRWELLDKESLLR